MAMSLTTLVNQLNSAGKNYKVPPGILLGVFGMETNFGNDVKTSSTGAQGLMQFEPATAAQFGYPLTNTPTPAQAQQQFNSAAQYLAYLYKNSGNDWNTALQAYSGGGYGLSQVQAKAKAATGTSGAANFFGGASSALPSLPSIRNPLSGVSGAITDVWTSAVKDAKYAAVLVAVLALGAMLIFRAFSGGGGGQKIERVVAVP